MWGGTEGQGGRTSERAVVGNQEESISSYVAGGIHARAASASSVLPIPASAVGAFFFSDALEAMLGWVHSRRIQNPEGGACSEDAGVEILAAMVNTSMRRTRRSGAGVGLSAGVRVWSAGERLRERGSQRARTDAKTGRTRDARAQPGVADPRAKSGVLCSPRAGPSAAGREQCGAVCASRGSGHRERMSI